MVTPFFHILNVRSNLYGKPTWRCLPRRSTWDVISIHILYLSISFFAQIDFPTLQHRKKFTLCYHCIVLLLVLRRHWKRKVWNITRSAMLLNAFHGRIWTLALLLRVIIKLKIKKLLLRHTKKTKKQRKTFSLISYDFSNNNNNK